MEGSAAKPPRVIELNDEGNAVRSPATFADAGLSLEDRRLLFYRAVTRRFGPFTQPFREEEKAVFVNDDDCTSEQESHKKQL